jgi:hypothetical protein
MDDVFASTKACVDAKFEIATSQTGETIEPAIIFEGPTWEKGLLDVNVSALTDAIQELARRLKNEVSERGIITSRIEALDATLASLLVPQRGQLHKAGSLSVQEINGTYPGDPLQEVRKQLEDQSAYRSKQRALQQQSFEASFELRMDALRRDLASSFRNAESNLAAHCEAILVQTKDLASKEADRSAKACLAEEAAGLHSHVTKLGELLDERLKLLEDRLGALNTSVEGLATCSQEAKATSASALETATNALAAAEKSCQNQAVSPTAAQALFQADVCRYSLAMEILCSRPSWCQVQAGIVIEGSQ